MATTLQWQPPLSSPRFRLSRRTRRVFVPAQAASQRGDFSRAMTDAWRSANEGFEQLVFEAKKTAERLDRQFSITQSFSAVAESASVRAREIDRELEISQRWRTFSIDFSRNWPIYWKQIRDALDTPLGRIFSTLFLVWFALSGWLFRISILAVWILPLAGPLLIGLMANNLVIRGSCPACKRQFVGYKNQMVRCGGCGNTVWQPKRDSSSGNGASRRSGEYIDVDYESK